MGMVQTLPSPLKNMMMKDMDADTKRPARAVRCAEVLHCYGKCSCDTPTGSRGERWSRLESQQRVLSLAGNVTPPLPVNSSNTMKDITHTGSISADRGQQLLPQGVNSAKGGGTKPVSQKQRQVIETLCQQRGISPDSVYHDLCDRPLADLRGQDAHKVIQSLSNKVIIHAVWEWGLTCSPSFPTVTQKR